MNGGSHPKADRDRPWRLGLRQKFPVLVLIAAWLSACAPQSSAAPTAASSLPSGELIPLTVCYSAPTTTQAVPWYAFEKGIFAKYGLKVNLIRVQGSSEAVTTLISGDAALCEAAGNGAISAVAAGKDVVLIASIANTYPALLVAQPSIKTTADLKGKKVGTGLATSASDLGTRLALQKMGLNPETDVILVPIGEEPARYAALEAGRIDAALASPPYLHVVIQQGMSQLFDFSKINVPYAHTSIVTTRKFLTSNRTAAIDFVKAIIESIHLMKQDPDGTKAVLAKYLGMDVSANAADLEDAYQNVVLRYLQDIPNPSPDGLQTLIDLSAPSNPAAAKITPAQLVDTSILKELEDSGFIAGILKQ